MNDKIVKWRPEYEIGIEDIDFQHHFFLNLINRLASEIEESDNLYYRAALIEELNAYGRFHFLSEENMMLKAGYPEFTKHKALHFELLDQLSARGNMLSLNNSNKTAMEILDFLVDWFLQHTIIEDRLFSEYLQGK